MESLHTEYRELLERWILSAREHIFSPAGRPELTYYGTGTNIWGIQTHQKAFAAFAVLAADPDTDSRVTGLSRRELLETSLAMLRFTLHSHHVGNYHCMDSETEKWGHHWLSPLAIERMMHGVEAIWAHIPPDDKALFGRLMISECNWILENRAVQADPVSPNLPESNLWNGAILHRTTMMYPDTPKAAEYKTHGTHLLMNSVSLPSDAQCGRMVEGKPVSEWFVGANFFESGALNHHGYLNVGYMVICLSNMTMLHFAYRARGQEAPAALYQHMEYLWQLVKSLTFEDGRLLRIGGDTRVRYCYCQDYLVPTLLMAADCLSEETKEMERGWLNQVKQEMEYNGDGSFLSKRCELLVERSPLYYTRLESDRACTLSMAAYWRRVYGELFVPAGTAAYPVDENCKKPLTQWYDEYHGACYVRDPQRMASFVWMAGEGPTALCVPPFDSTMAEWKNNLTSFTQGNGFENYCNVLTHNETMFDGGFVTAGKYEAVTAGLLEENDAQNINLVNHIAFAALPDGRTTVTLQYAKALRRCHLVSLRPLNLNIPNDVFNHFRRNYSSGNGWLNIDGKLSVIAGYGGMPEVYHSPVRQIGIKYMRFPGSRLKDSQAYAGRGTLCCDEICIGRQDKPQWFDRSSVPFDFGAVLVTGLDDRHAEQVAGQTFVPEISDGENGRALCVTGQDGHVYLVIANFSDQASTYTACGITVALESCTAKLVKLGNME